MNPLLFMPSVFQKYGNHRAECLVLSSITQTVSRVRCIEHCEKIWERIYKNWMQLSCGTHANCSRYVPSPGRTTYVHAVRLADTTLCYVMFTERALALHRQSGKGSEFNPRPGKGSQGRPPTRKRTRSCKKLIQWAQRHCFVVNSRLFVNFYFFC